jgi:hypothetical protein
MVVVRIGKRTFGPKNFGKSFGHVIFETTLKYRLTSPSSSLYNVTMEPDYRPSYRASLIKRFGGRIPTTAEGIPTGYYRIDFLPPEEPQAQRLGGKGTPISPGAGTDGLSDMSGFSNVGPNSPGAESSLIPAKAKAMSLPPVTGDDDLADQLRGAFVSLNFDHGYPAIPNGMPFWHKLDFESGFAFAAFQFFLESGEDGPRELYALASNTELMKVASAQAGKSLLPRELLFSLQEYAILNCWSARSKAFDIYKESAWRHQRLRRQARAEDGHFSIADKLLKKLENYFETDAFMKEMTPKAALDALSKLVAIQRVSLGLPAGGPLPVNQQPESTSFEMIMRNVATAQGAGQSAAQRGGAISHTKEMLDQVLLDPAAAMNLQEVIIRVTSMTAESNTKPERRFPGRDRDGIIFEEPEFIDVKSTDLPR